MRKFKNRPNYLDQVAVSIRDQLDESWYDGTNIDLIEDRSLYRHYAIIVLAKGPSVTTNDVHNAWAAWQITQDERNGEWEHPLARPLIQCEPDVQQITVKTRNGLRKVAELWKIEADGRKAVSDASEIEEAVPVYEGGRRGQGPPERVVEGRGEGIHEGSEPEAPSGEGEVREAEKVNDHVLVSSVTTIEAEAHNPIKGNCGPADPSSTTDAASDGRPTDGTAHDGWTYAAGDDAPAGDASGDATSDGWASTAIGWLTSRHGRSDGDASAGTSAESGARSTPETPQ